MWRGRAPARPPQRAPRFGVLVGWIAARRIAWAAHAEIDGQILASIGERGVVGHGQIERHEFEERFDEALRLAQRQLVEEAQASLNGEVGVDRVAAPLRGAVVAPAFDGLLGDPDREATPLDKRVVVLAPILDLVSGLGHKVEGCDIQQAALHFIVWAKRPNSWAAAA